MACRVTGDSRYRNRLHRQLSFIRERQRHASTGAWHMLLHEDGTVRHGHKGHGVLDELPIKAGYHVTQALYHAARHMEAWTPGASACGKNLIWDELAF